MIVQAVPAAMSQLQSTVSKNFPGRGLLEDHRQAAFDPTHRHGQSQNGAAHQHHRLGDVGPNHRFDPARHGVHDAHDAHHQNAGRQINVGDGGQSHAGRYSTIAVRPH